MRVTVHVISVSRTKPQVISSSYSLDASPPMKHTNVLSVLKKPAVASRPGQDHNVDGDLVDYLACVNIISNIQSVVVMLIMLHESC